jgi:hypothetical protein
LDRPRRLGYRFASPSLLLHQPLDDRLEKVGGDATPLQFIEQHGDPF